MEANVNNDEPDEFGVQDRDVTRTVPTDFDTSNIRKIRIADGSLINCEHTIRIDNDEITHSEALDTLLSGALRAREILLTRDRLFNMNDDKLQILYPGNHTTFESCTVEFDQNLQDYVFNVTRYCLKLPIVYVVIHDREVIALSISSASHLYNLHEELKEHPKNVALLHFKLACYYQKVAEENDNNVSSWQNACYHYVKTLDYKNEIVLRYPATIGYSRCLIRLCKFTQAKKKLEKLRKCYASAELCFLLARVQRKTGHNDEALETIRHCLELESNYRDGLIERTLIEEKANRQQRLLAELAEERQPPLRQIQTTTNETTERRRNRDRTLYKILSIDGGGFRGLIPAIWLTAIERATRCCSSIFHMLAGTSTGAIIACGLSIPSAANSTTPHYTARDIVDLYTRHASEIFTPATGRRVIYRWLTQSSRYSRTGRERIFNRYFCGALLCNSLTDIVVPVVQADHIRTHLFTRYDSRNGNIRPTPIVDILMSTTAAPTYFRPHTYDYAAYVDGGVQMNNPTAAAYSEALRYGNHSENIFVLSLGTGDYVHDRLYRPTANRNSLFWLRNSKIILKNLFDIAQNNVDYQMNSILRPNNYRRWQVWFEDEILLDDYSTETRELLEDYAYTFLEELEARDDDKRWGVIIERLLE